MMNNFHERNQSVLQKNTILKQAVIDIFRTFLSFYDLKVDAKLFNFHDRDSMHLFARVYSFAKILYGTPDYNYCTTYE